MKNSICNILTAVLLTSIGSVQADWLNVEEGLELDLTRVSMPQHSHDRMSVQKCANCPAVTLVVTPETTYHLGLRMPPVSLRELQRSFYAATYSDQAIMYVYFSPDDLSVNRIILQNES